jgi:hypothetical protein
LVNEATYTMSSIGNSNGTLWPLADAVWSSQVV